MALQLSSDVAKLLITWLTKEGTRLQKRVSNAEPTVGKEVKEEGVWAGFDAASQRLRAAGDTPFIFNSV